MATTWIAIDTTSATASLWDSIIEPLRYRVAPPVSHGARGARTGARTWAQPFFAAAALAAASFMAAVIGMPGTFR
mgnify:CR=1 FL=1